MTAVILDGKLLASKMEASLIEVVKTNATLSARCPGLAVILIGSRPDSTTYVRNKQRTAARIGIDFQLFEFSNDVDELIVADRIRQLNDDSNIDGIILQLPLPAHLNSAKLVQLISPKKDVDGLHTFNLGALLSSKNTPYHLPCTPQAVIELIDYSNTKLTGAHVVLIGCGDLVGRPLALCLIRRGATVTCCHSETINIQAISRLGDIVIAAAGCPLLVKEDWIKPGAIVIDVGINSHPDGSKRLVGDVDYNNVAKIAGAITPVPGGVGPMTVIMLMKEVVNSYTQNNLHL